MHPKWGKDSKISNLSLATNINISITLPHPDLSSLYPATFYYNHNKTPFKPLIFTNLAYGLQWLEDAQQLMMHTYVTDASRNPPIAE